MDHTCSLSIVRLLGLNWILNLAYNKKAGNFFGARNMPGTRVGFEEEV